MTTNKNDNNDKNGKGNAFKEQSAISPNVQIIQLGDAIKELKEKMRLYELHHKTETALSSEWDAGCKNHYLEMKSKYQELQEKRAKLLL